MAILPITVVVPTCNRPADLRRCLQSLASVRYATWTIVVVDQSDGVESHQVVQDCTHMLPQVTYCGMLDKGLSLARNRGLDSALSGIVAFLDDDCTVAWDWLDQVAAAFERHPSASLVFGTVVAPEYDRRHSFIPEYVVTEERVLRSRRAFARQVGMGASMCLWPARAHNFRRFDAFMGAGTRFPGAEERDFAYRTILAEEDVVETPAIQIVHHGIRSHANGDVSRLWRNYALGCGAMDMKLARCGDSVSAHRIAAELWRRLLAINLLAILTGKRPTHIGWFVAYAEALLLSLRLSVDPHNQVYLHRQQSRRSVRDPLIYKDEH